MHSTKYEIVKKYYKMKIWDERRVSDAVRMGWITEEEFEEIVGRPLNGMVD